jgi:hypothetical protein
LQDQLFTVDEWDEYSEDPNISQRVDPFIEDPSQPNADLISDMDEEDRTVHIEVYTDGSALQNEKAGIGIVFCDRNYANVSLDVSDEGKTSSFAELKAIKVSLDTLKDFRGNIRINTDSQ